MGARTRKRGLCQGCKKRPRCGSACARLEAELERVSGYQRETTVSDKTLEALAERAAAVTAPDPAELPPPLDWTRARVLARLTRRQGRVLELVFWEGLSVAGAAERLRIDRSAALRRYRNALARLRRQIRPPDSRREGPPGERLSVEDA